jgi:hypothetical protein
MIVNFKVREISRDAHKLTRTLTLIKIYIYIYIRLRINYGNEIKQYDS